VSTERRILLPLVTSVELFRDRSSPEPAARAKLASVLFDKVIFERGLLEVEITTAGRDQWWTSAEQVTPEKLERTGISTSQAHRSSSRWMYNLPRGTPPPEAMHVVMAEEIKIHYVAEWISVLAELLFRHRRAPALKSAHQVA
jgi:hypothetical protein